MGRVVNYLMFFMLCLVAENLRAQEERTKEKQIEWLEKSRENVRISEREALKKEVLHINAQVESGEITHLQAEELKKLAAEKHARNIENRLAIIENRIALLERNNYDPVNDTLMENRFSVLVGAGKKGIKIKGKNEPVKYDLRTGNQMLFAFGFNNAIREEGGLNDTPYKIGGSGFIELGWNWNTRLLKNSNFWRLKYGFSMQWNKLNLKDNQYFVKDGASVFLEQFPIPLKKAKFRTTYLVLPLYLEFGPSKRMEKDDRIRYLNNDQFKMGIGGFAGVNLGTMQKLKYKEDGKKVKDKSKQDFGTNDFVYGLGAYVGIGDISVYAKYNLSTIFKDQYPRQNNISLGLRFDLD